MDPLLRRRLSFPLFSHQVQVTLEPINGATLVASRNRFLRTCERISFVLVHSVHPEKQNKPYLLPDIVPWQPTWQDPECVELPSLDKNTPIAVGDLFHCCYGRYHESLPCLQLQQHEQSISDGFILAKDLPKLSTDIHIETTTTITASSTLASIPDVEEPHLPLASVLFPDTLEIATEAMKSRMFALCGERGSGKTYTALVVASVAKLRRGSATFYLDCRKLRDSSTMQTLLSELCSVLDSAANSPSACCILDDLDLIAPRWGNDMSTASGSAQAGQVNPVEVDQSYLVTQVLLNKLSDERMYDVFVLATCHSNDSMATLLTRPPCFVRRKPLPSMNSSERFTLFSALLGSCEPDESVSAIFKDKRTATFRPRDLEKLAQRMKVSGAVEDLGKALQAELGRFTPLSMIGVSDSASSSGNEVQWSELGGMFEAKLALTNAIVRPYRYQKIYERAKMKTPRGTLLYGFSGTGKSAFVSALAKECGLSLIKCRGPEILDKYIGASEGKVRELFAKAAMSAPSILFLDELDALAPRRGSDHTGVTDRIVNQLLTFLDGVEDFSAVGSVFIVAATSRPDKVDPALLRPGRLETHVYFGCEHSEEEQEDLLIKMAKKFDVEKVVRRWITSGFENDTTIQMNLSKLSPADLKSVFQMARLSAIKEAMLACPDNVDKFSINLSHIKQAVHRTHPSLSHADKELLSNIYDQFQGKPRQETSRQPEQLLALR